MAGDDTKVKNYKVLKRNRRRKRRKSAGSGRSVVFVCNEVLKEVWIHSDEVRHVGVITFVTISGKEIRRTLVYTWFPQGIWKVKFAEKKDAASYAQAAVVGSENVDPVLENRLKQLTAGKQIYLYRYVIEGKYPFDRMVDCLHMSAKNREIIFRVTYTTSAGNGDGLRITKRPLSDDYIAALRNELVARLYLIMLEHFAGINIDEKIALGGISRKEYRQILKIKSNNKSMGPRLIARVTTQAAYEYGRLGPGSAEFLTLMLETLLYQRKRLNPLATNNQLEIAKGIRRGEKNQLVEDVGIKRRGESVLLLYDKFGNAIPAYVGYMDKYYRNLDLDKVPMIKIEVGDSGFAQFLRVLEQTFAYPTRETYVLMASISEFYKFIVDEIGRLYGDEIQKKVAKMLPMAIGFFVVHAVVGAMARRGNPYAAALIVIAKAIGWIMNIDMGLATAKKMAIAGRHYGQMEMIHRRSPKEKGKQKLTTLSKYHLEVGTRYLIDAMSDLIAQGVFIAGGKIGMKSAKLLAKGAKIVKARNQAKIEVYIENGQITKIRSIKGKKIIEVQTQVPIEPPMVKAGAGGGKGGAAKAGGSKTASRGAKGGTGEKGSAAKGTGKGAKTGGAERTTPTGKKLKAVDSPPLEDAGRNMGRRQRTQTPKQSKTVKVSEYKYTSTDPKNRPASSEAVSGMPDAHLKHAMQIAKDQGVMVIFRTTNPRGVQHILAGHPPKGKDLIALNTDPVTGKVTIRTRKQWRVATGQGYYVLHKNGFAYNRAGRRLRGPDGKPVKYDMKAKGKHGELTNKQGQVIDGKSRKAVVGDYDLQDVIQPHSPGRNLAAVPDSPTQNVSNPIINRFARAFNAKLRSSGDVNRVVHGADAQFMQYRHFRNGAFKGDAIGILPDGRVVYLSQNGLAKFYKAIGRSRLDLGSRNVKLEPSKKD